MIGLLGILCSSFAICFLATQRIKLAGYKSLFIINVAVNDVLVSILGFFRGLGILSSKFVGAAKSATTPQCVAYAISLNSYANSGLMALLPLTIDRAVAIILPLKHKNIITKMCCVWMLGASWTPTFIILIYNIVAYKTGLFKVEYYDKYHRCVVKGKYSYIEEICLIFVPFILIILLYGIMLCVLIRKTRRRSERFLITVTGIVMTSLLSYSPTVIADTWNVPMSYEVSQVLTVTLFYTNGIVNPLIYVLAHPTVQKYFVTLHAKRVSCSERSPTCQISKEQRSENNSSENNPVFSTTLPADILPEDIVHFPNTNTFNSSAG